MKNYSNNKETILLLGGAGFIGQNIIDYLNKYTELNDKYTFIVLYRSTYQEISQNCIYIKGDYTNQKLLKKLFSEWNFTKVFHCGTATTPLSSNNNIIVDINNNLIATIGLLETMKEFNCKFILYISSGGAVYGENFTGKISEKEICTPVSSYGVVKLTIENYIQLYQKQFGIDFLILRVSNPFGKFHTSEIQGVINIGIRRSLRKKTLQIWGDGSQTKDYIFADDLVEIIFKLLQNKILNKIINLGSGTSIPLKEILKILKNQLPDLKLKFEKYKSTDVKNFYLDTSLLNSLVDFRLTNFDEAVKKTIDWEKNNLTVK